MLDLLNRMKLHASNEIVMIPACGALLNIAADENNNKILIGKEGGIPILLNVKKLHASNTTILQHCDRICKLCLYFTRP